MTVIRGAATLLAAASLAALALPRPAAPTASAAALVVTRGASVPRVRHLADSSRAAVYVLDAAGDARRFGAGAQPAPDLAWILRRSPGTARWLVSGWGLDEAELTQAGGRPITFAAEAPPPGIATIRWSAAVPLGGRLVVRGTTTGLAPGTLLRLDGPAGGADSARTAEDSTFTLSARPSAEGRFRYIVRASPGRAPAAGDTLGVSVVRRPTPAVLILDASPSFESRYLEDWLRRSGGSLAARTAISRARFRTRYVNRPADDLGRLTPEALQRFDVVLLDAAALAGMPAADRVALETAVREGGLGVVVAEGAGAPPSGTLLHGFSVAALAGGERTARLAWDGESGRALVGIAAFRLTGDDAVRALVTDSSGGVVAAWRRQGAGAVALTLVTTPSRWQLGGEPERFASYWSLLLGAAARPPRLQWVATAPALVDQPMRLVRLGPDTTTTAVIDSPDGTHDSLFLAQDPITPTRWEGTWWPRAGGWHRVNGGSASLDFLATGGWQTATAVARHRATLEHAGGSTDPARRNAPGIPRRVVDAILFAVFLAAVTVLWSRRAR